MSDRKHTKAQRETASADDERQAAAGDAQRLRGREFADDFVDAERDSSAARVRRDEKQSDS